MSEQKSIPVKLSSLSLEKNGSQVARFLNPDGTPLVLPFDFPIPPLNVPASTVNKPWTIYLPGYIPEEDPSKDVESNPKKYSAVLDAPHLQLTDLPARENPDGTVTVTFDLKQSDQKELLETCLDCQDKDVSSQDKDAEQSPSSSLERSLDQKIFNDHPGKTLAAVMAVEKFQNLYGQGTPDRSSNEEQ